MPGPTFAAVLDEVLAREGRDGATAPVKTAPESAWAWRATPPVGSAFLFARPLIAAEPRWAPGQPPLPRPPAHPLTDVQRLAFERLVLLGAALSDHFTADELRHEYRRLARRYHPDGYGDCGALEQAQRARCFAEAADDYRVLRDVAQTRH